MEIVRPKGVEAVVIFPLIERGSIDFATGLSFASGDVVVSKDGGSVANTTNLPTEIGNGLYKLTLTATEMSADLVSVVLVDQTTVKTWEDQALLLATYDDTYQAKVWYIDDETAGEDRYVAAFFKNGNVLDAASVTSPEIQVYQVADGADLVAATGMTQVGSTDSFRYTEGSNRIVDGAAYVIKVTATIDSATRQWLQPIGRDL
ncbi:MAG: hypothetical protein JXB07_18910 [Anaerolineae bacterium]|nr:hypothetical protein [Anaerolineae bacterium]